MDTNAKEVYVNVETSSLKEGYTGETFKNACFLIQDVKPFDACQDSMQTG